MPDTTATIVDNVYEAWNRHDAPAIAASFAAGGVSADPLTRVRSLRRQPDQSRAEPARGIRDLRICVIRTIAERDVEAHGEGDLTFGHSTRSWVSKAKPGALGMTSLLARDERRCCDCQNGRFAGLRTLARRISPRLSNRRGDGCTRQLIGSGSPTTRSVTVAAADLL
jgi:hypothetical protein